MSEKNKKNVETESEKLCPPIRNVTHPLRYYEFTQDEIKALEECDKESFYRRCLPFSTLFAAVTYMGIRNGVLRRHPHWGVFPKVAAAALGGHVLGRVAHAPHCDRRLRALPADSRLGALWRRYHALNHPPPPKQ